MTCFLNTIHNPDLWPTCCIVPTLAVLVEAIFQHGSKISSRQRRHSVAQQWIRKILRGALHSTIVQQIDESTTELLLPRLQSRSMAPLSICHIQIQLELLKDCVGVLQQCATCFLPCIFDIMQTLDYMETIISDLQSHKQVPRSDSVVKKCQTKSLVGHASMETDYDHGDLDEGGEESYIHSIRRQHLNRQYQQAEARIQSVKKFIRTSTVVVDNSSEERKTLRIYKTKCFQYFFSILEKEEDISSPLGPIHNARLVSILYSLIDEAANNPWYSGSICWCILLLVQELQKAGEVTCNMATLAKYLWKRRQEDQFFVNFFFTILSECSYFDNVETLWTALIPFQTLVTNATAVGNDENSEETASVGRVYRFHFALLLKRRGSLLKSFAPFKDLCVNLSRLFGAACFWVCANHPPSEREQILDSLRFVSILGISLEADGVDDGASRQISDYENDWLPLGSMIRLASRDKQEHSILSTISLTNGVPVEKNESLSTQCAIETSSDIVCLIFSFLSFKRVCQMRLICKEWRDLADQGRVWLELYKSRFNILPGDTCAADVSRPWKQLFQDMIFAQRELRALRCKASDSTLSICRFVGCTKMMAQKALENHHRQHIHAKNKVLKKRDTQHQTENSLHEKAREKSSKRNSDDMKVKSKELIPIISTLEWDVRSGRTKEIRQSSGNKRFDDLINSYKPAYHTASNRQERLEICNTVYKTIHSNGGRFLERIKVPGVKSSSSFVQWKELSHTKAMQKIVLRFKRKNPLTTNRSGSDKEKNWDEPQMPQDGGKMK